MCTILKFLYYIIYVLVLIILLIGKIFKMGILKKYTKFNIRIVMIESE
jgi:hypothetical protein